MEPKFFPKQWILFKMDPDREDSGAMGKIVGAYYDSDDKQWRYKVTNPMGDNPTVYAFEKDITHLYEGTNWVGLS